MKVADSSCPRCGGSGNVTVLDPHGNYGGDGWCQAMNETQSVVDCSCVEEIPD